jgi:hypothetical protein
VVVAVSDTDPVHRCGRKLPRPAKRLAIAGGLVLASWALGAVLGTTTASAEELPPSDKGTVAETSAPTSPVNAKKDASAKKTKKQAPAERKETQSSSSGELLGGLLGSVVNTLGTTVNAVTGTVTGLVTAVHETVLQPITSGGATGNPPPKLPIIGDLLPTPSWSGHGQWESGGTVTSSVPAKRQAEAVRAAPQPEAPQPAAPVADTLAVVSRPVQSTHISAHVVRQRVAVEEPAQAGKHFSAPSGGGSGDGRGDPPAAPTTVFAGHDGSGGARQQNAVIASSANTTQLRLIGTSLDHEVDGAGRDAALPTTSPD